MYITKSCQSWDKTILWINFFSENISQYNSFEKSIEQNPTVNTTAKSISCSSVRKKVAYRLSYATTRQSNIKADRANQWQ